jgi:cytosine deaminase
MLSSKLLTNARAAGWDSPRDILIEGEKIARIGEGLSAEADSHFDLGGRVVVPGFVEAHTHIDKAYTLHLCDNAAGTLDGAIREMYKIKETATVDEIYGRAEACLLNFISHGATTVRTHIDVDHAIDLRGMEALLRLRDRYREKVTLQLVPLAGSAPGATNESEYRKYLREAVSMGADAVGGVPTLSFDSEAHLEIAFATAAEFNLPIDLHVDESDDPNHLVLEQLAEKTIGEGWQGRVVAGHCCSLAAVDDATASRVIDKVAEAGISVITLPLCNLYLQGRGDTQPVRRGITRVKELLDAGVNVFCASDNVQDAFGPYGRADTLEAAWLTGLAAHLNESFRSTLLDMVTGRPAKALGLGDGYGLREGAPADLVVMASESPGTVVVERPGRLAVFRSGKVVSAGAGADVLGIDGPEV